ncbi:cation:proton antiporter domain-containing protein [Muricoccus pecuniae]|uniref:CPA1 family monovalent cation:H+ antiporter n=1 Tax=Muricoccus pecuniae TaxID=693023 RepID=A0A840YLS3_9PROT|nr:cation:proton antiporter [Roseomonas pecuniae]MBB5695374.1 CPA1 family monovalent cation:H+ antiporter [Roseomonas pecuniae]
MTAAAFMGMVLALTGPLLAVSRLVGLPTPLLLVGAGLAVSALPGLPPGPVEPQLLISLFLPPIIYASAIRVSVHLFRFTLGTGVAVGIGLAAVTIPAVALVARLMLPGLDWAPALLLGIVGTLFDTRIFHEAEGRPQVPRAVSDALKVREIVARIAALGALALVVGAVREGAPSPLGAAGAFAWALAAGVAAGWALGRAALWLRKRAKPAPVEIAVSVALPYLCALVANALGLSLSATIIAAALTVSTGEVDRETGETRSSSEARISATAFWEELSLLLSAMLFLLAGRALPRALEALESWPLWQTAGTAAALAALILALQFLFSLVAACLPAPAAALRNREREAGREVTRLTAAGVMAWACTPSILGIVVALSAPPEMGDRGLTLVVAAFLILGGVVVQGLTLGAAVRAASLGDEGEEKREGELAKGVAAKAAEGAAEGEEGGHDAVRRALLRLREDDHIGDEVLQKMLRETDLSARAAEGPAAALPGAGPPNP